MVKLIVNIAKVRLKTYSKEGKHISANIISPLNLHRSLKWCQACDIIKYCFDLGPVPLSREFPTSRPTASTAVTESISHTFTVPFRSDVIGQLNRLNSHCFIVCDQTEVTAWHSRCNSWYWRCNFGDLKCLDRPFPSLCICPSPRLAITDIALASTPPVLNHGYHWSLG